jgi:hypothetical protein
MKRSETVRKALKALAAICSPASVKAAPTRPSRRIEQTVPASQGMATHDPAACAEDFHHWAITRCVFRDRCFGSVGALLSDFTEWQAMRDEAPCTRKTFESLLRAAGFLFADRLVSGLYRASHESFERYVLERWKLTKSYVYRQMTAATIADNLTRNGGLAPASEVQVRQLRPLSPTDQRAVWADAVQRSGGKQPDDGLLYESPASDTCSTGKTTWSFPAPVLIATLRVKCAADLVR